MINSHFLPKYVEWTNTIFYKITSIIISFFGPLFILLLEKTIVFFFWIRVVIKVGRLVTCFYNIVLTAKGTSTGAIRIGGFPFSSASTPSNVGGGVCDAYSNMTTTGVGALFTKVQANNTFATLRRGATGSGTSSITLTDADISATFTVGGTLTYIASQ